MRDSKKLTFTDLFCYGFYADPVYDYDKHEWHIRRYSFKKHKLIDQAICDARGKRTYATDSFRKIISFRYEGKTINISLAKFIYVYFTKKDVEANYYACINENLADPYLVENITIKSKEEVERHKNKGNQYHSEKWHIIAKKYE